tara:strand:- start:1366 stop:1800 length:435 start_codon:yes stop_codon:yes gene_type:complete
MVKKIGRPSLYSTELAKDICDKISSNSKGLKKLCAENAHWPNKDTIFTWLKKHPQFADQYAQAKRRQIETFVDEILEIADDSSHDQTTNAQGNVVCNSEFIARSRLRIDTRKWLASKLVPKVYGNIKDENISRQSLIEIFLDKL